MIYAIGDIQGCYEPFQCLLKQIDFNIDRDQLWLAGDLVNRGPQSLETLRFCVAHKDNIVAVQGNHDLHLLATAFDPERKPKRKDTLAPILEAKDKDLLLNWLLRNPLLHIDHAQEALMVHAGIAPSWDINQAQVYAREVEQVLQSPDQRLAYFQAMYGNEPNEWNDQLTGPTRWRTITNFFTRMRLCDKNQGLDLSYKGALDNMPEHRFPWYETPNRKPVAYDIYFGHWAALEGKTSLPKTIALDHGCVWGNRLSAFCLDNQEWFHCDC
ncbi:MAG: symmetrical bis(5'-nucleosyl)-tetraphosphatase [Pseudomonadales bacterium]|nr:symmetrical bis(5'-nucleosyl)-tetraphosphatase [Pseudomonadales bacterium]